MKSTEFFKIAEGTKVYDPRSMRAVVSDNPALVMAHLATTGRIFTSWNFDDYFWERISKLADFCDEQAADI